MLLKCQQQEQQIEGLRRDRQLGRLRDILPHLDELVLTAPGNLRGLSDALRHVQFQVMKHDDRMDSIYRALGAVSNSSQQNSNLQSMLRDYVNEIKEGLDTMQEEFAVLRQLIQRSAMEMQRFREQPQGEAVSSTTSLRRPTTRIRNDNSDAEPEEEEVTPAGESILEAEESDTDSLDSDRRQRYLRSRMEECSDPELWTRLHHGEGESSESDGDGLNEVLDVENKQMMARLAASEADASLSEQERAQWTAARIVPQKDRKTLEREAYLGDLPMHRMLELFGMMAPDLPLPLTWNDEGFEAREDAAQGMVFDYVDGYDQRWTFGRWGDAMAFRNANWFGERARMDFMDFNMRSRLARHYDAISMPEA